MLLEIKIEAVLNIKIKNFKEILITKTIENTKLKDCQYFYDRYCQFILFT